MCLHAFYVQTLKRLILFGSYSINEHHRSSLDWAMKILNGKGAKNCAYKIIGYYFKFATLEAALDNSEIC